MIPLPSELILPFAGFLVSDPTPIEPITGPAVELLDRRSSWRPSATRSGSLVAYAHRRLGRPAVPRALRALPADPAARDRGRGRVLPQVRRGDRVLRPAAADRPDVHLVPGGRDPDADRQVHRVLDGRRAAVVDRPRLRRACSWARTGRQIREILRAVRPRDPRRRHRAVRRVLLWWRLGHARHAAQGDARPNEVAAARAPRPAPRTRAPRRPAQVGACR